MEAAARGRIDWGRHFAGQHDVFPYQVRVGGQRRGKQRTGVGVQGVVVDLLGVSVFHDLPQVHDGGIVGHVPHCRQIVGDEQEGDVELVLQNLQQVHHLGADGDIQRRNRLVEHNQLGVGHQGAGHGDALTLASAELVGILVCLLPMQPHLLQYLRYPYVHLFARHLALVNNEGLSHDVADAHSRA